MNELHRYWYCLSDPKFRVAPKTTPPRPTPPRPTTTTTPETTPETTTTTPKKTMTIQTETNNDPGTIHICPYTGLLLD